ncbi:hypothetical protein E3A20_27690, partial [Planctomyces bekefii]
MPQTTASRRRFVTTALAASAALAAPATSHASRRFSNETIIDKGKYQYLAVNNFAQLNDKYSWQTTHNVALDSAGNLYVIHEGRRDLKDHPSIFVFHPAGKFIRLSSQVFDFIESFDGASQPGD